MVTVPFKILTVFRIKSNPETPNDWIDPILKAEDKRKGITLNQLKIEQYLLNSLLICQATILLLNIGAKLAFANRNKKQAADPKSVKFDDRAICV
jgi:hypothetical protein